jgi:hypothetical protein
MALALRQAPPARTWTRAPLLQLASLRFRSNNALDSLCFASGTWLSTCPDMGKSGACAACITSSSTDSCKNVIDESVGWDRNLEMNQGSDVVGKCGFPTDGASDKPRYVQRRWRRGVVLDNSGTHGPRDRQNPKRSMSHGKQQCAILADLLC